VRDSVKHQIRAWRAQVLGALPEPPASPLVVGAFIVAAQADLADVLATFGSEG